MSIESRGTEPPVETGDAPVEATEANPASNEPVETNPATNEQSAEEAAADEETRQKAFNEAVKEADKVDEKRKAKEADGLSENLLSVNATPGFNKKWTERIMKASMVPGLIGGLMLHGWEWFKKKMGWAKKEKKK